MELLTSKSSLLTALMMLLCLCNSLKTGKAQAKTDPTEVQALNTILGRWGKTASSAWNISGEPCSGAAIDTTLIDDTSFNPAIKCVCTYSNNTVCHITQLKVYALDVVGPIPQELRNLTFLSNLNLGQNYLTGPLPSFLGELTTMQYMTFGINALSGPIPPELGNLQNLILLGMGSNNFSGSIPSEFGNLTSLEQWYMDSSGVSGPLPSTLSKLKSLKILWASDNNFTGKIPDYIGSWQNLTVLRFQGNSFEGPIPDSFSNLTKLTDLRIGDIENGTSSLSFISNMASLATLILRNSKISDTIPPSFSVYQSLQKLDLSFNNITGQLPQSLFNLSSLNYLFLGNNSLFGSLPQQKSTSLVNIDLSYNQLSGSFPSWTTQKNLQLNLVANNFTIVDPNSSGLPSGLNCLQQNIPCNRGSPIYYSFAINSGGSKTITASDNIVYEFDNATLTSASYYVTGSNKWAASSVGSFADSSSANYIIDSQSQFQNTLDSELFQSQRITPSSLRYYGLGLENGNYSIKLQFSETRFPDPPRWESVGRRVFDIYIQGSLQLKDFDIRKEAGGSSFKAVVKEFIAPVTNNFLEIHFFWAGKGTCCVPDQGYYGGSISAISVSPFDFIPSVPNSLSSTKGKNLGLIVGLSVGVALVLALLVASIFIWRQKKRSLRAEEEVLLGMTVKPDIFSFSDMKSATANFNPSNKLGEGGFGSVFKGKLPDGRIVAVKQLSVTSHQGKHQFLSEIATISAVQHRNLVKLYGCCIEGEKQILVYEHLENKSLDQAIFGKSNLVLDWLKRFEICLGVAKGLAYLHEESSVRIIHRDVKASNILLDSNLNPKISDFGLAKLYDDKKSHVSTRVAGTIGYLAPEYAMRGHLTEKVDVYAFGVLVLEIVSGRPNSYTNLDDEKVFLLDWVWKLHENNTELEMVDPKLTAFDKEEVIRAIRVALLCVQALPDLRPTMSRVVAMLVGDVEVGKVNSKPSYLTGWQQTETSISGFSTDYGNSTQRTESSSISLSTTSHTTDSSVSSLQPLVKGKEKKIGS